MALEWLLGEFETLVEVKSLNTLGVRIMVITSGFGPENGVSTTSHPARFLNIKGIGNMEDKNIGKVIGIYTIQDVHDERDRDDHLLYKCECNICHGIYIRRLSEMKCTTQCHHQYANWSNRRIGKIFNHMVARCTDASRKDYRWYGAKGIRVCEEWANDPQSFEKWAIDNGYADHLTIDRIDENKDYCPSNCQWMTLEENSRKAGKVNWITIGDETLTGAQWSDKIGVGVNRINTYIRQYGVEKTTELISAILQDPISNKTRKPRQNWFAVYGIQV